MLDASFLPSACSLLLLWLQLPTCILTATSSSPDPPPKPHFLISGACPSASAGGSMTQAWGLPSSRVSCWQMEVPPGPRGWSRSVFLLLLPSLTQRVDIHQVLGFRLLGLSQLHPLMSTPLSSRLAWALLILSGPL